MTSLNKGNGFKDGITPQKLLRDDDLLSRRLPSRASLTEVSVYTSLQMTLAMLSSQDLDAMLTVFRSVACQIETILLERQLIEVGYDAVKVSRDEPGITTRQEPMAVSQNLDTKSP